MEDFLSSMKGRNVTFLCPQRTSAAECTKSFFDALKYVKEAFHTELKMKEEHCKFILAPYNESDHWILIVVDLRAGVMLHFDPLARQSPRELRCAQVFKHAYKQYRAKIKPCDMPNKNVDLVVKQMECPQQTGGTECGYYVMRYMYEIVTLYSECDGDLAQEFVRRKSPYTKVEMDEVREQWARFFRPFMLN